MCICIIVIPVYKEKPDNFEILSFKQVLKVLGNYPIAIITYPGFVLKEYYELAQSNNVNLKVEFFSIQYFQSLQGYNRLCLNEELYLRFSLFEYMLIYQLDAFVFSDQLEFWCNKGYDYIGAPWFEDNQSHEKGAELWAVGNGGFSLRKLSAFINLFNQNKPIYPFKSLYKRSKKKGWLWFLNAYFFNKENTLQDLINAWTDAEDIFYCLKLTDTNFKLNIPSIPDALQFSFEQSPEYLFNLNNNKLPFGCHAWSRYEYETFWHKKIHDPIDLQYN